MCVCVRERERESERESSLKIVAGSLTCEYVNEHLIESSPH
jgi:hypothetical protein